MVHALILAAGFGSRLGHDVPKALIEVAGKPIIQHQLDNLAAHGITDVWVVTGFKGELVRAAADRPGVRFVDNPMYMDTNTGKSTLVGISAVPDGGVLCLNGDVMFDDAIVPLVTDDAETTSLAVDPRVCGDEEIKFRVREGRLQALSKQVHGEGEAVGISFIAGNDRALYRTALEYIEMQAYFERAIEHMLPFTKQPVRCVPIGELRAMEIDFPEDLEQARALFE